MHRSVVNAKSISTALAEELAATMGERVAVPIVYFEDSNFRDREILPIGDPKDDWKSMVESKGGNDRRESRQVNLCPDPSQIVAAVKKMICSWQECCTNEAMVV
jgi:hypothetical protein